MSDYLWDKTGEPEEDVRELENLLGTLRYEPRPLKLSEDNGARATARNSFRAAQRPFGWQRLALAASLLLTLLAGAWLVMKLSTREVQRGVARQNNNAPVNNQTNTNDKATQAFARHDETANNNVKDQPAPAPQERNNFTPVNYPHPRRVFPRDGAHRPRRALNAEQREQIARADAELKRKQKEATEQLLLALRITSAKLNYAQREMQEASARKPETR